MAEQRVSAGIAYTLTRRRVRNINLRVRADGSVAASAPARLAVKWVDAFVASRADWVRAAQARAARRAAADQQQNPSQKPVNYKKQCYHEYHDKCHHLVAHPFIILVW